MANIDLICFNCMRPLPSPWAKCPYCGHDNTIRENDAGYLPAMLLQGQYFVGKSLGRGGFGITYLGLDLSLDRVVAIKEYFPTSLSTRMPDSRTLHAYNASMEEYEHGCEKAVEEGRIGARVGRLPNVVQIYNVFQANNTAYIVMEYIQGSTLAGHMKAHGGKLPWAELQRLMFPVISSLGKLHEMKIIHRDVSPDNIMIREPENEAVLLDFGAAHTVSDKTMSEHSISLRLGYAPLEQYSRLGKQDGRIDEYAMCATMYYALTGQRPPDATERMYAGTEMTRPRQLGSDIPAYAENALMKGLSLRADERYNNMDELLLALQGKGRAPRSSKQQKKKNNAAVIVAASVAVLGAAAGGVVLLSNVNTPDPAPVTPGQSTAAPVDVTDVPTDVPTQAPTDVPTDAPTATPKTGAADDGRVSAFGFEALTQSNGTCMIIGYNGTETVAGVPEIIEDYYVTTIASLHQSGLKELSVGSHISEIQEGAFSGNAGMTVWVDDGSEYFYHQDDMIIRKEDMRVVYAKEREHLVIPEGVKGIEIGALPDPHMENGAQLERISITLPASMNYCIPHELTGSNVGRITVAEGNPDLRVENELLIYRDEVLACPPMLAQQKVTIPSGVTEIADCAFSNSLVQYVVLPDTVTTIGDYAFEYAQAQTIVVPASVTEIGDDAFFECVNLTLRVEAGSYAEQYAIRNRVPYEVYLSHAAGTELRENGFVAEADGAGGCSIIAYEGPDADIVIPEIISGVPVTEIGCINNANVRNVYIHKDISKIGKVAFNDSTELMIHVAEENPYFYMEDDMLIQRDGMCLLWAKVREELVVPEGIRVLGMGVLLDSDVTEGLFPERVKVSLPSTLEKIENFWHDGWWNVEEITVAEGNRHFRVEDGVLIQGDLVLVCPPKMKATGKTVVKDSKSFANAVEVPSGITEIGEFAFAYTSVESVILPESVVSIGDGAFRCSSVHTVNIPAGVTKIGSEAFYECENLTLLVESGSYAEQYAINNRVPYEVITYEYDSVPAHFQYREIDGGVAITGYTGDSSCVQFPAELDGKSVVAIDYGIFRDNMTLTHVLIPEGVKRVENHAFCRAKNLVSVLLPESLESIGIQSFSHCPITSVYLGKNMKDIHVLAFEGCDQLTNIELSPKNTAFTLVDSVLARREDMAMVFMPGSGVNGPVTIPEGVRVLKGEVHRVGQSVSRLNLPSTLEQVDGMALMMLCNGVPPISFPNGNTHIYWNDAALMCRDNTLAYYDMSQSDGDPVIPEGTERIASGAFMGAAFDELVIPASVRTIEADAFRHSMGKRIVISAATTDIEMGAFEDCQQLTLVVEAGSAAEAFAREWEIPYEVTGAAPGGDIRTGTAMGSGGDVTVRLTTDDGGRINWIEAEGPNETKGVGSLVFESEGFMGAFIGKTAPITEADVDVMSGATITSRAVIAAANDALSATVNAASEADFEYMSNGQGVTITKYLGSDIEVIIPASIGGVPVTAIGEEAFACQENIRKVYIPDGVTALGHAAFNECFSLEEVRLPQTLELIADWAFGGCHSLQELTIPAGVTQIEDAAFPDQINTIYVDENNRHFAIMDGALVCTDSMRLLWTPAATGRTLTVPEGVRELGNWSVRRAETVVLPSTLETMADGAFNVCYEAERVVVAEGNPYFHVSNGLLMKDSAVVWCPDKIDGQTITLPAEAREVASYAFFGKGDKDIIVPGSVKKIGWQAFSCCRNGSITLEEGVETLDGLALSSLNNMTVTLPASINNIPDLNPFDTPGENVVFRVVEGSYVQRYMDERGIAYELAESKAGNEADFEVEVNGADVTITRYVGDDSEVVIPDTIGGLPVRKIAQMAFQDQQHITKVTIPEGVNEIQSWAFSGCSELCEIILPDSLMRIDTIAFQFCNRLVEINLPANVNQIKPGAFYQAGSLARINVDSGNRAYANHNGVLVESGTMTMLWTPRANDEEMVIPEGVKRLARKSVDDDNAKSILLPASLEDMEEAVLFACDSLQNIHVSEGNPYFTVRNGLLMRGNTLVVCPRGIQQNTIAPEQGAEEVAGYAFWALEGKDITIPGSVKKIGSHAFGYNYNGSITLMEGVEELSDRAFAGLDNVTLTLPASITRISSNAFEDIQQNVTIRVVDGSYAKWFMESNRIPCEVMVQHQPGTEITEGDFTAVVNDDMTLTITGYTGSAAVVDIPPFMADLMVSTIGAEAFQGNQTLTQVLIPDAITNLEDHAFNDCHSLKEVRLSDALDHIGEWAFGNCWSLEELNIPASVREIEPLAFSNSGKLQTIRVAEDSQHYAMMDGWLVETQTATLLWVPEVNRKVQIIPEDIRRLANWTVSATDTVELPATLEEVSEDAFLTGWNVKKVTVAEGNPNFHVSNGMLMKGSTVVWCPDQLEEETIVLPAEATEVARGAFGEMGDRDFVVPGNVKHIGICAFNYVHDGSITLEEGVESVAGSAFANMSNVTLTLPESLTTIEQSAFENWQESVIIRVPEGSYAQQYLERNGIAYETVAAYPVAENEGDFEVSANGDGVCIDKYVGKGGDVVIPAWIGGQQVIAIGSKAFEKCASLRSVVVPEGVREINLRAFYDCDSLHTVRLPSTLTYLGIQAFYDSGLTSMVIPANLETIEESAFGNNFSLKSISVDEANTHFAVMDGFLVNTDYMGIVWSPGRSGRVVIPEGIATIAGSVFGNSGIAQVHLPASLVEMTSNVFANSDLEKITVADGNTGGFYVDGEMLIHGEEAVCFPSRSSVKNYRLPDSVRKILSCAFFGIEGMEVTVPGTVEEIGSSAFEWITGCNIVLEEGVKTLDFAVFHGAADCTITLPESLTVIREEVFWDVENVTVRVVEGSVAHEYAVANGVPCEVMKKIIPGATITEGDFTATVNEDKTLTITAYNGQGGKVEIPAQIDGVPVTHLGEEAFCEKGLTGVVIPEGITYIGKNCFKNNTELASLTLPSSLRTIDDYGFFLCDGLQKITIPEGVETIGVCAFNFNSNAQNNSSIALPSSIKKISQQAFDHKISKITVAEGNTTYTSIKGVLVAKSTMTAIWVPRATNGQVTIPEGVRVIPLYGLKDDTCKVLSLPASLESIVCELPTVMPNLKTIKVANGNKHFTVKDGLLMRGNVLIACVPAGSSKKIQVPADVEVIGNGAFDCCDNKTITLPGSIKEIRLAFYNTSECTIILQEGITNLGSALSGAYDCTFTLPLSITQVGEINSNDLRNNTFRVVEGSYMQQYLDKQGIKYEILPAPTPAPTPKPITSNGFTAVQNDDGTLTITGYTGKNANLKIPNKMGGKAVTAIADNFLPGETNWLKSLTIPEGVTRIGDYAFQQQHGLTTVTLPSTLKSIGEGAFQYSAVEGIVLPEGLEEMGKSAFCGCNSLMTLVLPSTLETVPDSAFESCGALSEVNIPEGVKIIGARAFFNNQRLWEVALPMSLEQVCDQAFDGCDLQELYLPDYVTWIGYRAFADNENLHLAQLEGALENIGESAFEGCELLDLVYMPSGVSAIGVNAFEGCDIARFFVGDSTYARQYLEQQGYAYNLNDQQYVKDGDYQIQLNANGTCTITGYAYKGGDLVIPETIAGRTVVRIGNRAFYYKSLNNVVLPTTLRDIGFCAFGGAGENFRVEIPATVRLINDVAFFGAKRGSVTVAKENEHFVIMNDMLVATDTMTLLWVPAESEEQLVIPEGVRRVAELGVKNTKTLTLPASMESIDPNNFFAMMQEATTVKVATGNKHFKVQNGMLIRGKTLVWCPPKWKATKIQIPDGIQEIGKNAFSGSSGKTITVPGSVRHIGPYAFYNTDESSIILNEGVKTIKYGCFQGMMNGTITFPASIEYFHFDRSLIWRSTTVKVVEGSYMQQVLDEQGVAYELIKGKSGQVVSGDFVAMADLDGAAITAYVGPGGTVEIPAVMDDTPVTGIAAGAFAGRRDVRRISIPAGVQEISAAAFGECEDLLFIVSRGSSAESFAREHGIACAYRWESRS